MESQDNGVRWSPLRLVALAGSPAFAGFSWSLACFARAACGNRTRDLLITSETLCGSTSP